MAALATAAELATYLQTATAAEAAAGNPDALDTARANLLLDNASADIRDECGWSITTETVTDQRLWDSQWLGGTIILPTLRLTAFSMKVGGVAKVDGTDFVWDRNGSMVRFLSWSSSWPHLAVEVTYTHGYATAPHNVRDVCLELAAAAYPNPSRYRSETIEGVATLYAPSLDLTTERRLNSYRLPPGVA